MNMNRLNRIRDRLQPIRSGLLNHGLYNLLTDEASLRLFMEHHVFAVWDFMSVLKTLQLRLTCASVPWTPPRNRAACRLINEIVLAEESDQDLDGGYCSHFDLYRQAMQRFGASAAGVDALTEAVASGQSLERALRSSAVPAAAARFIRDTFDAIGSGQPHLIAAIFTFGREDLLPDVFQQIVDRLNTQTGGTLAPFIYYLQRHIDLDGGEHGRMSLHLVETLCGEDPERWSAAEEAASRALLSRQQLWDGVVAAISEARPAALDGPQ